MVLLRSLALMPVVVPWPFRSTLTVNGVSCTAVLSRTIRSRSSSRQRCSVSGAQMSPRPCVAMKFTTSGVALRAAVMKSPSFSRSSSSTTITTLPARISAIALLDGVEAVCSWRKGAS